MKCAKKPLKAVALKYKYEKDIAPKITAKGKGISAENIIKIAKEEGIPIKEDINLVEMLSKIELDKEIPPNLYKAVSEVFSFLYNITKE